MRKLIAVLLLTLSVGAMAQHHGHRGGFNHHPGYGYGWGWSVPVVVGGAIIGYELARVNQPTVVVQQPPNIIYSSPVYGQNQTCTPWTETQHLDGSITRTRTCSQ